MRNDSLHTKKAKEDAASFLVATHGSVQRTRSPLRGLHTHALTHARGQGHPRVDGGERCDVQLLYLDLEGGKKSVVLTRNWISLNQARWGRLYLDAG